MMSAISRCRRRSSLNLLPANGILLVHADRQDVCVDAVLLLKVGTLETDAVLARTLEVADEACEDLGAGHLTAYVQLCHYRPSLEPVRATGGREYADHAE